LYADSLAFLFGYWIGSQDYSHGMFVPLISLFLIWQARHRIAEAGAKNSWWGLAVILAGLFLYWIGELATLYVLQHVSLWLVIVGLVIASIGVRRARVIAFPLSYLFTSIPLPVFLYASLSSQLQLWSSALGVGFLQLIGVTAFRDGNVIDLGPGAGLHGGGVVASGTPREIMRQPQSPRRRHAARQGWCCALAVEAQHPDVLAGKPRAYPFGSSARTPPARDGPSGEPPQAVVAASTFGVFALPPNRDRVGQ